MAKWKAPLHTSAVALAAGSFIVDETGHIETDCELGAGDIAGLAREGFLPVDDEQGALELVQAQVVEPSGEEE